MRYLLIVMAMVAFAAKGHTSEPAETGLWITGDPFIEDQVLFFRADKLVEKNPAGNVILLGAPKDNLEILPVLMQVAVKRLKVRLFGKLLPFPGKAPGKHDPRPNVQFIVWKIHMPEDPDELPEDQKLPVPADVATNAVVLPSE